MFFYVGSSDNKLSVVEVEEETGNLIQIVQTIQPIVDPPSKNTKHPSTEWVEKHPKHSLLYALTSFCDSHPAYLTTYRINKSGDGTLEKLGVCETGGIQASYATFSPDGSILCIAHRCDGNLSFFDCSKDEALEKPIKVLETPEIRPGTRCTSSSEALPSLQHVCYASNGEYLLTVDCSKQGRVWTYAVDERGLAISDTPAYKQRCAPIRHFHSRSVELVTTQLWNTKYRIRRIAFHPRGNYIYLLFESHSVIQVYEISPDGKILADCLQEIPSIDPSYFDSWWRPTGLAWNAPAEFVATSEGVLVSNRGLALMGRAESSIRLFVYDQGGAWLVPKQVLDVAGPVRHFLMHQNKIYSGVDRQKPGLVETFVKQEDGTYKKTGEAAIGMDVMCIAANCSTFGGLTGMGELEPTV
jgi:6-phosphogluconolactonase (cycloisomerase 2 family)